MNFNNSIIVKISFTNGIFDRETSFDNIVAAKIGSVAFLDPEDRNSAHYFFFPFN